MANNDYFSVETTISATVSDNDNTPTTMNPPHPSDDSAQCRTHTSTQGPKEGRPHQDDTDQKDKEGDKENRTTSFFLRMPKLKREKSNPETLERKKKRVKFSPNDDDDQVMVDTRVFEPQVVARHPGDDAQLSHKIKKLLKKHSKRNKSSIETQTEDPNKHPGNSDESKATGDKSSRDCDSTREPSPSTPVCPNTTEVDVSFKNNENDVVTNTNTDAEPHDVTASHNCQDEAELSSTEPGTHQNNVNFKSEVPPVPYPSNQESEVSLDSREQDVRASWEETGARPKQLPGEEALGQASDADLRPPEEAAPPESVPHMPDPIILEGQELEICLDRDFENTEIQVPEVNCFPSDSQDEGDTSSCQATIKREGTFTLDGPPPPKITKSSYDAENEGREEPSASEASKEPVVYFVELDVAEVRKAPESKERLSPEKPKRTRSTSRSPQNPPKVIRKKEPEVKPKDTGSTVANLKNTAKRTFVSAWKTAMKTHEPQEKAPKLSSPRDTSNPRSDAAPDEGKPGRSSSPKKPTSARPKNVSWDKAATQNTSERQSREPVKSVLARAPRVTHERSSMWSGVCLPSLRREGTYTKRYDSEKDRLQAEVNRLNVEKERLQSELSEARTRMEEEVTARKALRRTHELSLRQLRDNEQRRTEVLLADLKNRLEDEKREALAQQKGSLARTHEADLIKAERERDEDYKKLQHEAKSTQDKLKAELRREVSRSDPPAAPCGHANEREVDRLVRELAALRDHKKKLEESLATLQECERTRAGELRRLHEEHEASQARILKANKSEVSRLLDEVRSKDRAICQLERQVSAQSAKIRLQEEKAREASIERAEEARKRTTRGGGSGAGKRQQRESPSTKDGRPREKESCGSSGAPSVNSSNASIVFNTSHKGPAPQPPVQQPPAPQTPAPQPPAQPAVGTDEVSQQEGAVEPAGGMALQAEDLRLEVEKQKQEFERQVQQLVGQLEERTQQVEQRKQDLELQKQELEEQMRKWEEERFALTKQVEEGEEKREELQKEVEEKEQQVEEQKLVMEAQKRVMEEQKQVMDEQKQVMEEQQCRIADLTEDALDEECLAPPPPTWHLRRESCVKVCELPTVMEQSSDEESPTSTPSLPPTPPPQDPFPHDDLFVQSPTPSTSFFSPSTFLTPTTPGTEPMWPEVGASVDHDRQELHKSYQLLVSSQCSSPAVDHSTRDGPSEWWSAARVAELEGQVCVLKAELQEARDHADLLEFRVLELTEDDGGSESGSSPQTCDQSTATDLDDVSIPATNEDLSLPLSIDSGLDLSSDYKKARVSEGRLWLAQLSRATGEAESPAVTHLTALLDWLAALPPHPPSHALSSPMSPTLATPTPSPKGGMGVDEVGGELGRDLMMLAARLQETLTEPAAQESVLLDTIAKLRTLDTSLSALQSRVVCLTEENRELQEAVATLSDAHETRTEASGTESELVHRKTPSIHSDLSDSESDGPEHAQHRSAKAASLDGATSFQESGIFDTSCELVHVTTQTDLESDEYLRVALEEERVVLSKAEYDGIVEGERCLQRELDHLKCEKNQLTLECETLKNDLTKLRNSPRSSDAEEAMKGEVRVLRQRLAASERARIEVTEEKCELEEEENDARLMVQRLESQMEAAREMENLLSASLAQEQEISRELHRRVRDLQLLEKDYRGRIERMEHVGRDAEKRALALSQARDALSSQLSFAAWGLVIAEHWRQNVTQPSAALVPYKSVQITSPRVSDICVQTSAAPGASKGIQTLLEEDVLRAEMAEPSTKRLRQVETRCQSTMTAEVAGPTEREQYYLEQIESLQREKINLRKGQDNERRDSLQHYNDLEEELEAVKQRLVEAERDRCQVLFRLEETQDERDEIQRKLLVRIDELKGDISRYSDLYELEKRELRREYESRVNQVERERSKQEDRVHQLERHLSTLRNELEIVGVPLAELDTSSDLGSELETRRSPSKPGDADLLKKIQDLVRSEQSLKRKISELEKKECAYRETISEADKIMSSHMTSYKQRIEELEGAADQQVSKIQQLEASEERLRTTLRNNSRSADGERISDLLDRLIETENSELKLKERVWGLERSEKELQIKLMEGEKANQALRGELRDQEELVHRLMALETENNALSMEVNEAKDSARKMSEVQQSEVYLRGRVEELEVTEHTLRETLQQADHILAQREKKLRDQVSSLQEEVHSYKGQLERACVSVSGLREDEAAYRRQLDGLKQRLAEAERQIKESSSETNSQETQHRSEVNKLRNQLKLANSQLNELERVNCELRERVLGSEAEGQRVAGELEEQVRRHEQDLLSLNLQVSSGENRVKELQNQLEQLSTAHAASELDALTSAPIAPLHAALTTLMAALKGCESCSATHSGSLSEVSAQLATLTELLEGRPPTTDDDMTDSDDPEMFMTETAENLCLDGTTTPPPTPGGEGLREHTRGELTLHGALRRSVRRRSRRRLEECRLMRPKGSSTILEELEEKVRELEEAVGRKEEELRLADTEASELHQQMQNKDAALILKNEEMAEVNATLGDLREQLMRTVEEYERARLNLEARHKVDLAALGARVEHLTQEAERLAGRGRVKDDIIATLAAQIRAILRSGNMSVVINQIRRLAQHTQPQDPSQATPSQATASQATPCQASSTLTPTPDFDVEAVCSLLSQPSEMASLSQSATTGTEPSSQVTPERGASLSSLAGHTTCHGSSSLAQRRKSRIPRYLPSPRPKSACVPVRMAKPDLLPDQALKPVHEPLMADVFARLSGHASRYAAARSTEHRQEVKLSAAKSSPIPKPVATSTPAKPTARKDSTKRERPARFLSDARKIKRMVTGMAPLNAAVECSSAPEWQNTSPAPSSPTNTASPTPTFSAPPSPVEATCVPRPQGLHITRRVGVDGVVIAWAPLDHDCVAGFQVLVGGRVVQHVRSPHRTKALVTGLPMSGVFTIGLVTVAHDGRCSTPVLVTQDRSRVYARAPSHARTPSHSGLVLRCVPTCL